MLLILTIFAVFNVSYGLYYPELNMKKISGPNYGEPLFLTPLIEKGDIEKAQKEAKVSPPKENVQSYAGYLTVNKKYNSNMFFWYFPAEQSPDTAPVVLWLQGGPGSSSLYGLFDEHGPFYVKPKRGLKMRDYYWSQIVNVIYLDNPVGTGFSFTDSDAGYSKNEVDVGANLYEAVTQFFKLFPNLQKNDFFISGESYAGKYVPAIGYTIHNKNPSANIKINLKGLSIGNGLCDPVNMLKYSEYLYQIGLIDSNGRDKMKNYETKITQLVKAEKYTDAFKMWDTVLNGDLTPYKTLFFNLTGYEFYFNYLNTKDESPFGDFGRYLEKDLFRRSIHVGNLTFHTDQKVEMALIDDIMRSVAPWIETLIENYRILIYNGQLDIIVPYPLTVNFLQNLKWSGATDYKMAPRKTWTIDNKIVGYSKTARSLTELLVRDAGHMVPGDQPKWALDMISRFVYNKPF